MCLRLDIILVKSKAKARVISTFLFICLLTEPRASRSRVHFKSFIKIPICRSGNNQNTCVVKNLEAY